MIKHVNKQTKIYLVITLKPGLLTAWETLLAAS